MRKILKRIASAVTAPAVLLTVCLVTDVPRTTVAEAASHSEHNVCVNAENCHDCAHSSVTWTAWNDSTSLPTSGNYYLTTNVTVSEQTMIDAGDELSLCLNGCTITINELDWNIFSVFGILNICDCKNAGTLSGV